MTDEQSAGAFDAARLVAILRRRLWVVVMCAVIGGGAAFAVAKTSTKQYTSTAALLFQQNNLSQQLFGYQTSSAVDPLTQQATNLDLVTQPAVGSRTAHSLGIPKSRIASEISAAAAGTSDIVNVTATDPSPSFAARLVNEYADQFVAFRQQQEVAQVKKAASQLQTQITHLVDNAGPRSQIQNLQSRVDQLEVLESTQTGDVQVVQRGVVATSASSPKIKRTTALGLIAGLLVGLLAVALLERLDQTVSDPDEIRRLINLPVLGMIPASKAFTRAGVRALNAGTPDSETFRLLRTQLRYFNVDREIRSVLITSAAPGDGKSTVAWHLARESAAAAPDSNVLLIDADLRNPTVAATAALAVSPGLTELLTQQADIDGTIRTVDLTRADGEQVATLDVLTSGSQAPNSSELMESQKLRDLLHELHRRYDFIVVDAPPPSLVSDAIPLMTQVSGFLVVVRIRKTRRAALRRLAEQIRELQAHPLGLVLNDVKIPRGGYGYGYGYGSRAGARGARSGPALSNNAKGGHRRVDAPSVAISDSVDTE